MIENKLTNPSNPFFEKSALLANTIPDIELIGENEEKLRPILERILSEQILAYSHSIGEKLPEGNTLSGLDKWSYITSKKDPKLLSSLPKFYSEAIKKDISSIKYICKKLGIPESKFIEINKKLNERADQLLTKTNNANQLLKELYSENVYGIDLNGKLFSSFEHRIAYSTDATGIHVELPIGVFYPENSEDILKFIRLALNCKLKGKNINLVPRGAGTGMSGGAVPLSENSIIISTEKMKGIGKIEQDQSGQKFVWTQAGVINADVHKFAGKNGLLFAVDPASTASCSVGGNLSTGAGGPQARKWGTAIDNFAACKFVSATGEQYLIERIKPKVYNGRLMSGELLEFEVYILGHNSEKKFHDQHTIILSVDEIKGKNLVKNVINKTLKGLPVVQKEGVDGVVTDIKLALHEKPKHTTTVQLQFDDTKEGIEFIEELTRYVKGEQLFGDQNSVSLLKVEFLDDKCIGGENAPKMTFIIDIGGSNSSKVSRIFEYIKDNKKNALKKYSVDNEKDSIEIWKERLKVRSITDKFLGNKISDDIGIPVLQTEFEGGISMYHIFFAKIKLLEERYNFRWNSKKAEIRKRLTNKESINKLNDSKFIIPLFGHFGDGNIHVNFPFHSEFHEMKELIEECISDLFKMITHNCKGTISAEHGLGILKGPKARSIPGILHDFSDLKRYREITDPSSIMHVNAFNPNPTYYPRAGVFNKSYILDVLKKKY